MLDSTSDSDGLVLLGDIGGTNARFALKSGQTLGPVVHLTVADYPRFDDALAEFLRRSADTRKVQAAVFAVAGPVRAGYAALTNNNWTLDAQALSVAFGFERVGMVNDFAAVARSLPCLRAEDVMPLGGREGLVGAPMLVLGPGTGLGAACLVLGGDEPIVIASEAGHVSAPSWSHRTDAILDYLRRERGHVSAEAVVSGQGIENLYRAIVHVDGLTAPERTAAEITQCVIGGTCQASCAAIDLFFAMLGEFAGNMALSFGARGGVYLAGGILPRLAEELAASEFRNRFESKGRMSSYLEAIPCWLIVHPNCAFLGLEAIAAPLMSRARPAMTTPPA